MKKLIILITVLIAATQVNFAQELDTRTKNQIKTKFFNAKDYYSNQEYSKVLEKIDEIEGLAGSTILPQVQNLKVKALVGKGEFKKAKKQLFILEGLNLSEDILRDISQYSPKIENGLLAERKEEERLRAIELEEQRKEQERLRAEQELMQKKRNIANAIYPTLVEQLKQYNEFVEGRPYYSKLRKKMTSSNTEKAYFVFHGREYIIYTIPSEKAYQKLSDQKIYFSSYDAGIFDDHIVAKVPSGSNKYEKKFKRSLFNDKPSIGGFSDDILWNKYYSSKEIPIYYYTYYNTLYCDFNIKSSFQENYYNPYIETGTIVKTVDYDLVVDSSLYSNLKSAGFKHKASYDIKNPTGLEVKLISSGNIKMLHPKKKVNYIMNSKVKGSFNLNGSKYKGEYYYYESGKESLHVAYTEYSSSKITKNIFEAVGNPVNNYILGYTTFSLIYDSFKTSKGSGNGASFTNSGYRAPFSAIYPISKKDDIEYYPNGNIKAKGVLKNGKKYGMWEFFADNGALVQKITYYDFKGNLPNKVYTYDNDILISIENYDHYGKQNFEQYYFDPENSILQVAYFSDDVIYSDQLYKAINCDPYDLDGFGEFIKYREYDDNGVLIEK
ncbi:MAG: hypothetical protein C0598_03630 [Marinilabiliales bacterium]|nr:MAG: hypothetical protein C0598_03630 [Marinilabiliales bacterium]